MRRILIPVLLLLTSLAMAGCSASGGRPTPVASPPGVAVGAHKVAIMPEPAAPAGTTTAVGGVQDTSGSSGSAQSDVIHRQVVTTSTVVIKTTSPLTAADRAARLADDAGGRVDDRTQKAATKTTSASATLTLRVPATKLTGVLERLRSLGTIESIRETSDDVTTTSEDLTARITALSTSVTRLLALEAKATTTTDLIALENDISDRQGELDSLTEQQKYLDDQVGMSTISLSLVAPAVVASTTPSPGNAFTAGFAAFGGFFTWVLLVLTYLVPWILLVAVIVAAIVITARVRRRRGRADGTTTT
jgi:hypothetical protein